MPTTRFKRVKVLLETKKVKVVATNKHKSLGQLTNSLEEFKSTLPPNEIDTIIGQLIVEKGKSVYKNRHRVFPGAIIKYQRSEKRAPKYFVLFSQSGINYIDKNGNKYNKNYCTVVCKNSGLVFI